MKKALNKELVSIYSNCVCNNNDDDGGGGDNSMY